MTCTKKRGGGEALSSQNSKSRGSMANLSMMFALHCTRKYFKTSIKTPGTIFTLCPLETSLTHPLHTLHLSTMLTEQTKHHGSPDEHVKVGEDVWGEKVKRSFNQRERPRLAEWNDDSRVQWSSIIVLTLSPWVRTRLYKFGCSTRAIYALHYW